MEVEGHSYLLPPHQGDPKPWGQGQAGKMALLADSDRCWLPTEKEEVSWQKIGFEIKPGPWEEGWSETAVVRMDRGRTGHPRGETGPSPPAPRARSPHCLTVGRRIKMPGPGGGQI